MQKNNDTNILVRVDTGKINSGNADNCVEFTDDNGNSTGQPGNGKNFTSKVEKDKWVFWSGEPMDEQSNDRIWIIDIQRKPKGGGAEILDSIKVQANGTVKGKIKNKDVTGEELYDLTFKINDEAERTYTIDPKLRML